jgi:hypothetical protein
MTRSYSHNPKVHRELDARLKGGGQRGDDIDLLRAATRKRLGAVGFPESARGSRGDTWSANASDYVADALYRLGAAPDTVKAARKGRITVGAQRMVRYPGLRSDKQRALEQARADVVAKRASDARKEAAAAASTSKVSEQRARAARAATFALAHAGRAYTQGPGRWVIAQGFNPDTGVMFRSGDCSGFATAVVKYALNGGPDIVNGADWQAGYTGTMRVHGERVTSGQYQPGDCAIYGGGTGSHVVVCYRAGNAATARWASHGSAGGPYSVDLHYRPDTVEVRRYIGV